MATVGTNPGEAAHTSGSAYADPGYQADKLKRYPIDTPEHVRAALSYIGQAGNAGKYKPDELALVKARIYRAAKKFGINAMHAVADSAKTNQT